MSTPSPSILKTYEHELRRALTIRLVEQRLLALFSEGKLFGTVHTCIGQEFVGVSVARCLNDADTLFSNHRCHGHFLAYRDSTSSRTVFIPTGSRAGSCRSPPAWLWPRR